MLWFLGFAIVCFGSGMFWLSRSPAGWNWQKGTAGAIATAGPLILLVATCFSGHGDTGPINNPSQTQSAKKPILPGAPVSTNTGDVMTTNAQSFDRGHENGVGTIGTIQKEVHAIAQAVGADSSGHTTATNRVQSSARRNPLVVQTGDGVWEVKFHMPGAPRLLEVAFPLPLGKVYYISTDGLVDNLRVGKATEFRTGDGRTAKQFKFSPAPASEFCGTRPHMVQGSTDDPNSHLAFLTELVPSGDYTIKIMEPLIAPTSGEHSPGVPLNRWYK